MASEVISQMIELDQDSEEYIDVAKRFNQGTILSVSSPYSPTSVSKLCSIQLTGYSDCGFGRILCFNSLISVFVEWFHT